nr:uncharacterized protein LOC105637961 [Ipomoea batatas]
MDSSSKLRNSCSFPNLLLSFLNFILFILSSASVIPIILLRNPPTSLGFAFLLVSAISLLSSFIAFYSHLTRFCFITYVSLLLASVLAQILAVLALFTQEKPSLAMLKSPRDAREAKLLIRLECGAMMAMLVLQLVVSAATCLVHSCWVRDYEDLEARKRSRRIAQVQEEAMANAVKIAEVKGRDFDEKMVKGKYVQWVKTDFEG